MIFKAGILILCLLAYGTGAPRLKEGGGPELTTGHAPNSLFAPPTDHAPGKLSGEAPLDTCALLAKSEIASVQGMDVRNADRTNQKFGELEISQCYYTVLSADGTKNLSVYLQVIQRDAKSADRDALKKYWDERFGPQGIERRRPVNKQESERKKEKRIHPPLAVPGVGDEAFWLGSNRGGALFVLTRNKMMRVTVGGEADQQTSIEKSKMLAKKALARLT